MNSVQNRFAVHGQGIYTKGLAYRGPDYPSTLEAFTRLIAMTAQKRSDKPQFRPAIVFEYFPTSKINSVPSGTTAFMRAREANVLIFFAWTPAAAAGTREALDLGEIEKKNTDEARRLVKELEGILMSGQGKGQGGKQLGYSNYGALREDWTWFFVFFTSSTFWLDSDVVSADKAKLVFGKNYQRMRDVKRVYDPDGVFNKWLPIGVGDHDSPLPLSNFSSAIARFKRRHGAVL